MTGFKHTVAEVNPITIEARITVHKEWLATDLHVYRALTPVSPLKGYRDLGITQE